MNQDQPATLQKTHTGAAVLLSELRQVGPGGIRPTYHNDCDVPVTLI